MNPMTQNMFRYLPVSAGGQVFGIPFASIRQIVSWSEQLTAQTTDGGDDAAPKAGEELITINMRELLTGKRDEQRRSQVIIIKATPQNIALVVDSVAPMKSAEPGAYFVMPAIFHITDVLFGGAVCDHEELTLMIDPDGLGQILNAVRPAVGGTNYDPSRN